MKFRVESLVIIGCIGIALVGVATGWLMWLNWNDKVQATLLNFLLLGVLTLAGATLLTLHETVVNYPPFVTSIVVNEKTGFPPRSDQAGKLEEKTTDSRVFSRAMWRLWANDVFYGPRPPKQPKSRGEKQDLASRIVQYKAAMTFFDIQRRWQVQYASDEDKQNPSLVVNLPYQLSETERPTAELFRAFTSSPFHESDMFAYMREPDFLLPKGAEMFIANGLSSTGDLKERVVCIFKPNFFSVVIELEQVNAIPTRNTQTRSQGIPEAIDDCYTYFFVVRIRSRFSRWTSGNWRTEEYKAWCASTLVELQKRLDDKPAITLESKE